MGDSCENIAFNVTVDEILTDRTKINKIVDIIEQLDASHHVAVVKSIEGLGKIFTSFVKSGECPPLIAAKRKSTRRKPMDPKDPEEIFQSWLNQNYRVTVQKLLELLHCDNRKIQEQSLSTLMQILSTECQKLQKNSEQYVFANELFLKIVGSIIDGSMNMEYVITLFKQYLQFSDIRYYVLRNLSRIVSKFLEAEHQSEKTHTYFSRNVYHFLSHVSIPQSEDDLMCLFSVPFGNSGDHSAETHHSVTNPASHKKVFSSAWISFLNLSLDTEIHRRVLVTLHERVIPNLVDPKMLMDFLTDSYNIGGVTSIISLNSLFILIHEYNLDYPDFYKKLYSLFTVEIFHMKYRARFFHLADLFLTSTHLPAYLVAAFIKRLSRLALRAPPFGVALCISFVGNLIKRHPNCKILIHRKKAKSPTDENELGTGDMLIDPFIEDEPNPDQCQALESSLWELETLRYHYYPSIKSLIELFEKPFSKNETDLSEYFDSSFGSLLEEECVELTKNNAFVEFRPPGGLLSDNMKELWIVN